MCGKIIDSHSMPRNPQKVGSPAVTPPFEDVGADTQLRFRYQATYTAIISLGVLDENGPLLEIYCEHHDDILLLLKSGSFRATQIKTRGVGGVPFKSGDDEIMSALRKFAVLEKSFPSHFEQYQLATNIGFWHEKKNGSNLPHVLESLKQQPANGSDNAYVKKLAAKTPPIDSTVVLAALLKVELITTPGLDGIELQLREEIARISAFGDRRYDELKVATETLTKRILDAGSLAGLNCYPKYLALCSGTPQAVLDQQLIDSKRIVKYVVEDALKNGFKSQSLLRSHQAVPLEQLPSGMRTMEIKMAAGGLSVSEIDHLKDLKFSAETLLQKKLYRLGQPQAQECYEHLRVLVRDECLAASQNFKHSAGLYGSAMLSDLRSRLAQILQTGSQETFEFNQQALLGMAGILTEDCKVWWSDEFPIPRDPS